MMPSPMLLKAWLLRVWHWLAEIPTFWAFLAVLTVAICAPLFLVQSAENAIRYAGLVLQLVGVGVVAYTLKGRGEPLGHAPVITFAREWARRAPKFRQGTITLEGNLSSAARASATLEATVWRGPRLDQPIEAQLESIRDNIATLRSQVETQESKASGRFAELRTAIEAESTRRSAQIQETRQTLKVVAADSLYLEVAGLAWLVIGIALATIPGEIATLLGSAT